MSAASPVGREALAIRRRFFDSEANNSVPIRDLPIDTVYSLASSDLL
jgi:hypothetical protein